MLFMKKREDKGFPYSGKNPEAHIRNMILFLNQFSSMKKSNRNQFVRMTEKVEIKVVRMSTLVEEIVPIDM